MINITQAVELTAGRMIISLIALVTKIEAATDPHERAAPKVHWDKQEQEMVKRALERAPRMQDRACGGWED